MVKRKSYSTSFNHAGIRDNAHTGDPLNLLCCAVLTNAGREYMKVAMDATSALKRRKKKECEELTARLSAIRYELLSEKNPWTNYISLEATSIVDQMHRELKRKGCDPGVLTTNHNP